MPLSNPQRPARVAFVMAGGLSAWTNMPAALTELLGFIRARQAVDLTNFTEARLMVNTGTVAGDTNAELRLQYSTNSGGAWSYVDGSAGPAVNIAATDTLRVSSWVAIAAAARADVWLRIVGINGDGVIDPSFNAVVAEFR